MSRSGAKDMSNGPKIHRKPRYAVMGGGRLGGSVARELRTAGCDVVVVDRDDEMLKRLREDNFQVIKGDITDEKVIAGLVLETLTGVLLLTDQVAANTKALQAIRKQSQELFVVIRGDNRGKDPELRKLSPDLFLDPYQRAAVSLAGELIESERKRRSRELTRILGKLGDSDRVAIVLQETPDPDSIACGMALQEILASYKIHSELLAAGRVGYEENRAMVNLLNIDIRPYSSEALAEFTHVALVDTSVAGENNPLPKDAPVFIAIDHHGTNIDEVKAEFADIRPDLGAASTILVEYLREMNLTINAILGTALLYGIRSDTDEFRRNFTPQDFEAAAALYGVANLNVLKQIQSPARSRETVDVLGNAIRNKVIRGTVLLTNVGFITDKDTLSQAADYLINTEGITTAVVYGIIDERIHISARNTDIRINIGQLLDDAFDSVGSAGGHRVMAGAQIPLGVFAGVKDRDTLARMAGDAVMLRVLTAMGSYAEDPENEGA
ncbi:NAD-binding protein [bacterium]|nr:NAD-binding protein [candidate division CSSED10-310 bacterium]